MVVMNELLLVKIAAAIRAVVEESRIAPTISGGECLIAFLVCLLSSDVA